MEERRVLTNVSEVVQRQVMMSFQEVGWAIMAAVQDQLRIDDAGCDWYTCGDAVFIGGPDWQVARDVRLARLVDAANLLRYGHTMEFDQVTSDDRDATAELRGMRVIYNRTPGEVES